MQRPEPAEDLAQVASRPFRPLPAPLISSLQVGAGVGVQRGQDLVGVQVGHGVVDRDHAVAPQRGLAAGAGVERQEHVLEAGARAQQHGGVAADHVGVPGLDVHAHAGAPAPELDLADVADAHAGHAHGLALAGRHALGVGQLDPHRHRLLLEQREAQPLVGQDVGAHAQAQGHHGAQRDHVAQVGAQRPLHFPPSFFFSSWPITDGSTSGSTAFRPARESRVYSRSASRPSSRLARCLADRRAAGRVDGGLAHAGGGVQVRRLLRLARNAGPEHGPLGRLGRADAVQRQQRVGEQLLAALAGLHQRGGAAAGQHAEVGRVGVGQAALARQAHQRARGLLEERLLVGPRERRVRDRLLGERQQHPVLARGQRAVLLERGRGARVQAGQRRQRGLELAGQPAQLALGDQRPRLADERELRVQRRVGRARPRQRVAREPAHRRQRRVQRAQRRAALAQHVAQLGDGGAQVGLLAGEPGDGVVEVGDQLAQLLRVARQRAEHAPLAAQQPAQVVGLLPARGVGHLGAVAVGVLPVPDRLVEPARARALERAGVLLQQRPQVLARLGLQGGQHLVELHRRGRLLGRDRRAAGQLRLVRRARAQLDEVVALQEQARAHLELGVLVDRQAGVVDLHGHARVARAVLQRLDRRDLAPRSRPRSAPASARPRGWRWRTRPAARRGWRTGWPW